MLAQESKWENFIEIEHQLYDAMFRATCSWSELRTRDKILLGRYYTIKRIAQHPKEAEEDDDNGTVILTTRKQYCDICEFEYHYPSNMFIKMQGHHHSPSSRSVANSLQTQQHINTGLNQGIVDEEKIGEAEFDNLPLALRCVAKMAIRIYNLTGDSTLINLLNERRSFSKGVTTYRLVNQNAIRVPEDINSLSIEPSELIHEEKRKVSNNESESIKYMRSTLKSKEYVQKILKVIPIPKTFPWIILISAITAILAIGIGISQFAIHKNIVSGVQGNIGIFRHIPIQYTYLNQASIYIVQVLSVLE